MKDTMQKLLIASSLMALAGCEDNVQSSSEKSKPNTDMKFSVTLSNADVRRVSNGDEVTVDGSTISSGELTLSQ